MRLSAALAYYSIFSLAPLLIIVLAIAGLMFGAAAARGHVADQMRQLAGERAAEAIQALVLGTSRTSASFFATLVWAVVLLFGASGVFGELKAALNTIWGVEIKPGRPMLTLIRERLISFTMVVVVGFLLLVSLVISAGLAACGASMRHLLAVPAQVWQGVDFLTSFALVTLLFAMVFKALPNVVVTWRDVRLGACGTAFLFTIGKIVIGFYLGTSGVASYYGAAGSVIVILLWVYFSACILFFGAEFTRAYVGRNGAGIVPDRWAVLRSKAPPRS
jgi:membrane protein